MHSSSEIYSKLKLTDQKHILPASAEKNSDSAIGISYYLTIATLLLGASRRPVQY